MQRWSFYLFVPLPLQDELAAHVDRTSLHHGDGAVRGDRGGRENLSETILTLSGTLRQNTGFPPRKPVL